MNRFKKITLFITVLLTVFAFFSAFATVNANAEMPFYGLKPTETVLRAEFCTDYSKSSAERKRNIFLAAKSLNGAFIDVLSEFSFNKCVGARTEKRGYQNAKVIVKGKFVEGVGGGVCQVSTTLYNAALLAGLKITERHAHTLAVSYVEPSFDAMVSSVSDLKIVNCTGSPIRLKTYADGNKLTVKIFGEKQVGKITLKSVITAHIPALFDRITDDKGEYPELSFGEEKLILAGKNGLKSKGYLIKTVGKNTEKILLGNDFYSPINGVIVVGGKAQ